MAPPKPTTNAEKKDRSSRFAKRFSIGFTLLMFFLQYRLTFRNIDNSWADTLFTRRGMERGDPRITVVMIDDVSLDKVGAYPWPRGVYLDLTRKLFKAGVKVVGLDILFPDPSTSKIDDAKIIQAAKEAGGNLVFAVMLDFRESQVGARSSADMEYTFRYPFQGLHKAAKSFGVVNQTFQDDDGSVRRVPLLIGTDHGEAGRRTWTTDPRREATLGAKILAVYKGVSPDEIFKVAGRNMVRLNLRGEEGGNPDWIIDENGNDVMVRTPKRYGFTRIPAWRILFNELNAAELAQLKGGIVLIGSSATGAFDHFPTAFAASTPGVLFHANLVDNLLNGNFLTDFPEAWIYPIILGFAGLAFYIVTLPALVAGLAFFGLSLGWAAASYYAFIDKLVVVPFWGPMLTLGVTFLVLMVHKAMLEQQQKREVRAMFGQYVAPEVVDILVRNPGKIELGGQKRDMTVFFLDIAHFTTISEKMTPEALIQFLNAYLSALTDDILKNKGVVDKYIGDCIMAFWNAPLDVENHRTKACLAAVDCLNTIQRLNVEYVDPTIPEKPAVRIGLNSGDVVVGNTGSVRKLAYTVLGDDVNLASRLEGANKFFGSTVMASEDTYAEAKSEVVGRVLGSVRVVGKDIPIKVFELISRRDAVPEIWRKALPIYEEAVSEFLDRKFEKAKEGFESVLKIVENDKPSKLYLSVCDDYIVIPPPDDWDGVFNLTSK